MAGRSERDLKKPREDKLGSIRNIIHKLFSDNESEIFLPREIISAILIRLPLKSLGRFKCVCKLWCAIVEEGNFVVEYSRRSELIYAYKNETNAAGDEEEVSWLSSINGLVLEKAELTKKSRLRNPATKEILDLPNPCNTFYDMRMVYLPKPNNYKLIYIFGKNGTINGGCEVMTLGTDLTWRALDIPSLYDLGGVKVRSHNAITDDLFFITKFCDPGFGVSEIVCIDMGSEQFVNICIPQDLFSSWKNVRHFMWDKKLCLADKVEQELHCYILEDYKKEQWAQKKIVIHLSFLNAYPEFRHTFPYKLNNSWLWFVQRDTHHIAYNIESKKVHIANRLPPGKRYLGNVKYSPVSLARIQRKEEANLEAIQPTREVIFEAIQPKGNPNTQGPEFSLRLWLAILVETLKRCLIGGVKK
ncbi:hypothetical protein ACH5RR_017716 [Cinchona calisaya]|uniref:F-box domain-containing protein n=1 Tax=Cinchona calisaya TaxID=153742 RepID=A0ABD2ZJD2_9GENT